MRVTGTGTKFQFVPLTRYFASSYLWDSQRGRGIKVSVCMGVTVIIPDRNNHRKCYGDYSLR